MIVTGDHPFIYSCKNKIYISSIIFSYFFFIFKLAGTTKPCLILNVLILSEHWQRPNHLLFLWNGWWCDIFQDLFFTFSKEYSFKKRAPVIVTYSNIVVRIASNLNSKYEIFYGTRPWIVILLFRQPFHLVKQMDSIRVLSYLFALLAMRLVNWIWIHH